MDKKLKAQKIISPLLIVLAALIWGISFVAQSEGGDVGSFTFQSIRCTLAFLSIGVVVLFQNNTKKARLNKKKYDSLKHWFDENKILTRAGLICGVTLAAGCIFQQFGIDMQGKDVSTGRAAFLTALYIIFVPVFGIFFKKKVGLMAWLSVAVGTVGLYFISITPGAGLTISTADIMLIACAVGYGAQIITVDSVSDKVDGVKLSCIQFGITAVIATILMLIFEKPDMEVIKANALPLLYSGVLSGGAAFTLQIIGQKHCNHILAPLLMSLESVFSGLADWVIRGNLPTQREFIGFAVMFVAIIMAQLPDFKFGKKAKQ